MSARSAKSQVSPNGSLVHSFMILKATLKNAAYKAFLSVLRIRYIALIKPAVQTSLIY